VIQTLPRPTRSALGIPTEFDPRLVVGAGKQRQRLDKLRPAQRAELIFDRYPELRRLPSCDWERLSSGTAFSVLYGKTSRHFAHLELAALAGILASAGIPTQYHREIDGAIRSVLDLLQQRFGISSPQAITHAMWETWGRDTELMRTLTIRLRKYAAAVNHHVADYRERLTREDQVRVDTLLLPPLPKQFRPRFVPTAEQVAAAQRQRKAKTDVISECATAMLALMLARYPTMERFIRWYRRQIARIESGELAIPVHLMYEDDQLDLPRQPGPDAVNVEELRWRKSPVRLELTIWRPNEFSQRRLTEWIQHTSPGSKERGRALNARYTWKAAARTGMYADPRAYFVEVHPSEAMPWFMGPVAEWYARLGRVRPRRGTGSGGRIGVGHAGVGTPEEWLVKYLGHVVLADRQQNRSTSKAGVCFDPEATYRGVLFGSAIVTLMLTADARIHEILQISADRFVKPVRVYLVKNADGTPKRDPTTNKIITDVIVEQHLLPKGRKRDDLRLQYDVSAARVHLQQMTALLTAAHHGQIPVVPYAPLHPKAEQLASERYLFQWNRRHLSPHSVNKLIRLVLHDVVLVDRSGERIDVTSHLLRHAAATVQRQQYGVPLEILAEAMGHTLADNGRAPEATRYYSQMTETQKAEIRHHTIVAMLEDAQHAVRVIDPEEEARRINRLMQEADERTREMLERYGGLHPVTFGHCGYPGLCVRGTARAFCIGCPFLVRRPEYLDRVEFVLDGYMKAADAHERMGDLAGARERQRLISALNELRREMLLLGEAERQGSWAPHWKQLAAPLQTR
jgi:hypothetical protein